MQGIHSVQLSVAGLSQGQGVSSFLDPFYLFRGKLLAAATRSKFHDSADLRMLGGAYEQQIKERARELNPEYVGLSIKRYPELERLLVKLGVDVNSAKEVTKDMDIAKLPPPQPGDVQKGLLSS